MIICRDRWLEVHSDMTRRHVLSLLVPSAATMATGAGHGVVVSGIDLDGPAARAGIRRADVICEVNGPAIRILRDPDDAIGVVGSSGRSPSCSSGEQCASTSR